MKLPITPKKLLRSLSVNFSAPDDKRYAPLLLLLFLASGWMIWLSMPAVSAHFPELLLVLLVLCVLYLLVKLSISGKQLTMAREKAEAAEVRFDKIYNSGIIGLWFTNRDGSIVQSNDAFLNLTGYNREELEKGSLQRYELTPPEYAELTAAKAKILEETGYCPPYQKEYIRKDGSRVAVLLGAALLEDKGPSDIVAYALDISELAEANEEIRQSERRFRFIADAVPHKTWTSGADGKATYYNQHWYDYTGTDYLENLRGKVWQFIHPDDLERTKTTWEDAVARGADMEIEQRLRRHDGQYFWHLSRVCVHRDELGEVRMWVGTSTNIHAMKIAQAEIVAREAQFRLLADNNSLLIWQTDAAGESVFVNQTWRDYTGVTSEQPHFSDWINHIHPEDRERVIAGFQAANQTHAPYRLKYRFRDIRRDEYRWILDSAQPILKPDFDGYIGSMTDIDDQEKAQIAARVLMEKKDEFFGIASHELKTPITSMKASLQVLEGLLVQDDMDARSAVPFVARANKQVNKLTAIVNDLLDITRIQAGRLLLNLSPFDLYQTLQDCVEEVRQQYPAALISLTESGPVPVQADRIRIEQVILNFLLNAIKYSPEVKEISMVISVKPGSIKIAVTDQGIGIPEEKQSFVFDRFFRVHDSSQHYSGLGLGLYISAETIKKHGGQVGVSSSEGQGSTFWFTLPVSDRLEI